jgi:hypothetical protein
MAVQGRMCDLYLAYSQAGFAAGYLERPATSFHRH